MSEFSTGRNKSNLQKIKEVSISLGVGLSMALIFMLAWNMHEKQAERALKNKLNLTGQFLSAQFENVLNTNIRTLENLKNRIESTQGSYFDFWVMDADRILEQNPSFVLVEWIDSSGRIVKIRPSEGTEKALGLNISKLGYRKTEWISTSRDSSVNITPWTELIQGGKAFLVDAPVYFGGAFQGTITGGLDFSSLFDAIVDDRGSLSVQVFDQRGTLFYEYGQAFEVDTMQYASVIPVKSEIGGWSFVLKPGTEFYKQNQFLEYQIGMALALLIAVILSVTTYFMLRSSWESKRVFEVNKKLRALNVALDQERLRAEKASQIKTEFLSNMSHEIRTPLNAIMGLVSILQNQTDDEQQRARYLGMMEFSSKNLLSIVNDILEIDKVESGGIELNVKPFSPVQEVENLLNLYEEGFEKKQVSLIREIPSHSKLMVLSDPVKFGQVITNLVRNAYKFTEDGEVRIKLKEEIRNNKANLEIVVSDTGIGIPQQSLDRIFERFAQVESGMTKKYEGTGLGLAITKKIVEKLGGKISVDSEVGRGSSFKVELELPIYEYEVVNEVDLPLAAGQNNRVLIAEDNPLNVMVITKLLENYSLEVDVVPNGHEVLRAVENTGYDLIFMDIHMPEMDGLQTTRTLREKGVGTPVVALSANVTKEAVNDAMAAGMQDYVTKPFTREILEGVLKKFLSQLSVI